LHVSFSLIPSENSLSPLSKLFLTSDIYSRYYFEDDFLWDKWAFPGGKQVGEVQHSIVEPLLKEFTKANHVNIKPVSGLSNMIVCLSAYCSVGDKVLCLGGDLGGHASTRFVTSRLGLDVEYIEADSDLNLDENALKHILCTSNISLIYIDQANVLFSINITRIKKIMQESGSRAKLHVDTSHINGLIFGGVLSNPLDDGADSFGGSFHKTFPGPHKAFLATNDSSIATSIGNNAAHLVSHNHAAEVLALAVSLLEFKFCGGADYARQTVRNAQIFAATLSDAGYTVAEKHRQFTASHQVWIANTRDFDGPVPSNNVFQVGILVNAFGALPVFPNGGIRVGLNEPTRYGLKENETIKLAKLFIAALNEDNIDSIREQVRSLRLLYSIPKYCFSGYDEAVQAGLDIALHMPS